MISVSSILRKYGRTVTVNRFVNGVLAAIATDVKVAILSSTNVVENDERLYRDMRIRGNRPILKVYIQESVGLQEGDFVVDGSRTLKILEGITYYTNAPGLLIADAVEDVG